MILCLILNFYINFSFFVYLLVFTTMVLCKDGRLRAQIDKVKNAFSMDLHGWYKI